MKIKLGKPKKKQRRKRSGSEVNTESISEKGKFAIVESYKAARTNIMFALSADDNKIFAITSYSKGEGKSTVSVHNIFKLENTVGVSNVIGKMADYEETVHRDVLPNLDILTSGTIPPNPSELICSAKFVNLIKSLYDEYDYIIFDTPPIGVVSDALLLKDLIAGFVVVLRERSTTHGDIQNLLESIKLTDTKLLGFVKVGCTHTKHIGKKGYYYYQYYYYY